MGSGDEPMKIDGGDVLGPSTVVQEVVGDDGFSEANRQREVEDDPQPLSHRVSGVLSSISPVTLNL